jgi:hypothetical protein
LERTGKSIEEAISRDFIKDWDRGKWHNYSHPELLDCWQQQILVVDEPHICEACSHGVGCCLSLAEKDRSGDSEVKLELPVPLTFGELFARDLGRTLEEE